MFSDIKNFDMNDLLKIDITKLHEDDMNSLLLTLITEVLFKEGVSQEDKKRARKVTAKLWDELFDRGIVDLI